MSENSPQSFPHKTVRRNVPQSSRKKYGTQKPRNHAGLTGFFIKIANAKIVRYLMVVVLRSLVVLIFNSLIYIFFLPHSENTVFEKFPENTPQNTLKKQKM